ncbi:TonB-dependent receptor [Erythrobacter westpacificensis]|uniref:TonB-dependent receptor n=1 Tax=Erythrobacter westpacificensis TaxID=1055231 RepID=A0ABP9K1D8_9SPHN
MKVILSIGVSAIALSALPAHAQEDTASSDPNTIIVTAQKRAQDVQDVPVAITAISGEALQDRNIRTTDEIAQTVSNVQIYQDKGGSQPNWTIRGVSLFDFNVNNSPSTAIYIDEVYQPSLVMGAGGIFDLERVEVLKGPQAGLYGRNAIGGAVQIISSTARPGDSDGYVRADYDNFDRYRLEAAQSVTLTDGAAVRLSVLRDGGIGDAGWQTSLADGSKHGEPDRTAVRAILSADVGRLETDLRLYYARDKSDTALATGIGAYTPGTLNFCDAVLRGELDQANCSTLSNLVDPTLPSPSAQSDDGRRTLSQPLNQLDNTEYSVTLKLLYDLDAVTLTSITGYTDFDFGFMFDYDASPLRLGGWIEDANLENISQELRVASSDGGPLRWQVGAQYTNYTFDEFKQFDWRDNPLLFDTFNPIFGIAADDLLLDVTYDQKTEYWGIYGQFDYDITPDLTFSGSLRYSNEETTYRNGRTGFRTIGVDLIPLGAIDRDYELDDHWTGSGTLSYQPSDAVLIYATIAKGYKSGGIPGGFPQTPEDTLPYEEEIVINYEGGFKSEWGDGLLQLNGSIFYYDHDSIQAFATVPSTLTPGQFAFRLINVGDGYNFGGELEATLRPMRGLTFGTAIGYLDTEITDSDKVRFSFDNQVIPYEGTRLEFAPTWSGNVFGSYDVDLSSNFALKLTADYNFRTAQRIGEVPVDEALRGIDGYGIANGRIELSSYDGWGVALWGKNLLDETYSTDATNDGVGDFYRVYGEPRSVGVSLSYEW